MIKSIKTTSVQTRRKFDHTFKREAVQNWLNSGKSAAVVGEELGINANLLYAWRKLVPAGAGGRAPAAKPGSVADLQSQLEASGSHASSFRNWKRSGSRRKMALRSTPRAVT